MTIPSVSPTWPGSQLANLWWPADRAWFVVSEIDYDSTIVAGSRECIDAKPPRLAVIRRSLGRYRRK